MKNEKHYWLYVLKLEQGKYYVGITSRTPEARYKDHVNGIYAAEWTKVYKPIKIYQTADLGVTTIERTEAYENKVTRKYIKEYGFNNVRGGNITYRGNYVKIFRNLYIDKRWEEFVNTTVMTVLMIVFGLYTIIDLTFNKKIFGLWH
jgi:predicted GIY-YIG superfamily endonuclease